MHDSHLAWIDLAGQPANRGHGVWLGMLPHELRWSAAQFSFAWDEHPSVFHQVRMFGRLVAVPRWSATYGRDYAFAGTVQRALSVPDWLSPLLAWSQGTIDARLNALLVNWYDGALGHKIGRHRDDEAALVAGAPIVTFSFGETRPWRLRRWQGADKHDPGSQSGASIEVADGSVLVLPWATNMAFTHEVPASKRHTGKRISVTVRAFQA